MVVGTMVGLTGASVTEGAGESSGVPVGYASSGSEPAIDMVLTKMLLPSLPKYRAKRYRHSPASTTNVISFSFFTLSSPPFR